MKIEHIAMYVNDLEQAKDFFTHYFHAAAGEKYHNPKTGFHSYFLSFQGGVQAGDYEQTGNGKHGEATCTHRICTYCVFRRNKGGSRYFNGTVQERRLSYY